MNAELDQYITPNAAAEMLSVHRNTLWRLSKQGRFPAPVKVGPQAIRYRLRDVKAYLRDRTVAPENTD